MELKESKRMMCERSTKIEQLNERLKQKINRLYAVCNEIDLCENNVQIVYNSFQQKLEENKTKKLSSTEN